MLPSRSCRAVLTAGTCLLAACGPGTGVQDFREDGIATARALVRPLVSGNARTPAAGPAASGSPQPGPAAVVLAHRAADGTLRVGCVDSEDGAEALVVGADDAR